MVFPSNPQPNNQTPVVAKSHFLIHLISLLREQRIYSKKPSAKRKFLALVCTNTTDMTNNLENNKKDSNIIKTRSEMIFLATWASEEVWWAEDWWEWGDLGVLEGLTTISLEEILWPICKEWTCNFSKEGEETCRVKFLRPRRL